MHFRLVFFHGDFFHGRQCYGGQPNLGLYCLQYKLHNKIISKLHKNINRLKGSRIWFIRKKLNHANVITVILILTVHMCGL